MRTILLAAASVFLVGGPVLAQTPPATSHRAHPRTHATGGVERPIDHGPNTPAANGAYQGGGVILQGAPGAPAPTPQATPPGQMPLNAVPR